MYKDYTRFESDEARKKGPARGDSIRLSGYWLIGLQGIGGLCLRIYLSGLLGQKGVDSEELYCRLDNGKFITPTGATRVRAIEKGIYNAA